MTLLRQPSHLHMPWQWGWYYPQSRILWMHVGLIACEKAAFYWERESNESACIAVNLWDHTIVVWDTRVSRKADATSDAVNSIREADSSRQWSWESLPEVYECTSLPCQRSEWSPCQRNEPWEHLSEVQWPNTSMTLAWSSWERSLKGTRSYFDLLLWIALKVSLIPFLKSEVLEKLWLLIYFWLMAIHWFSLISRMPSLSELIMLISNSEGACFPVTLLLTCWGWGSPGGGWIWTPVEEADSEGLAADAELAPSADEAVESGVRLEEWATWESDSADSYLTLFFCWSKNFWTRSLNNIWS